VDDSQHTVGTGDKVPVRRQVFEVVEVTPEEVVVSDEDGKRSRLPVGT
jgi:hypothetical protein